MLESGADLLGADLADCIVENSIVKDTLMGEKISFSEILSETVIDYQVTEEDLATVNRKEKRTTRLLAGRFQLWMFLKKLTDQQDMQLMLMCQIWYMRK